MNLFKQKDVDLDKTKSLDESEFNEFMRRITLRKEIVSLFNL